MIKKGDLVRVRSSETVGIVTREPYTRRFMDVEDYEMVAHGMGEYAGIWTTAIEVLFTATGRTRIYQSGEVDIVGSELRDARGVVWIV